MSDKVLIMIVAIALVISVILISTQVGENTARINTIVYALEAHDIYMGEFKIELEVGETATIEWR